LNPSNKLSLRGQIAIPKSMRDLLNLSEGTLLTLEVRGHEIVLSREPAWKQVRGMVKNQNLIDSLAACRKRERELEDRGS
jgi:AbrB family looped-hinge helix DNA binding protein